MKILDLMEAIDEGSFNQMAAAAKDIQRTAQQPAKDQALSDKWAARKAAQQAPADTGANYGQGTQAQAAPAAKQAPAAGSLAGWQNGPTATTQEPAPSEPIKQPAPAAQEPAPAEQPTAQEPAPAQQAPAEPAEQPTAQEPAAAPAPAGPSKMAKAGNALKGVGNFLGKAADATAAGIGKVGNVAASAADAAGRTVGGAVSGYKYARGEQQSAQVPGQRQDAPQQAPAPQQQGGGALGAIANMTGGGQQAQGAPNFNKIIKTIPTLSANQKAQVIKAAGGGAKVAPPAPKVVQGGKPAMAVAESVQFYSNFLGRNL